jgi:translation initiation factor IF-3
VLGRLPGITKELRINQRIRAREVRLVAEKGQQLGIMTLEQALETARKHNLDLVEVAPTAVPPVCRLLDYGKYKYEQEKRDREARKSQHTSSLRQVRLRPKIDTHDFEAKLKTVRKLLGQGDKVRVVVFFRGREITHPDIGFRLLQRVLENLQDDATPESQPAMEGRSMAMILVPGAKKTKTESKEKSDAKDENSQGS